MVGQEFQWVLTGSKRNGSGGGVYFGWGKQERRVGGYFFYVHDAEFGAGFIKICTYFPTINRLATDLQAVACWCSLGRSSTARASRSGEPTASASSPPTRVRRSAHLS